MYCIIIKDSNDEWTVFTNEIWGTELEATDYAKRNNFKKNFEWKVVLYDKKYFNYV
jgi:hypothetical protein|tara:strand:+ start:27 stop:194 length:168 start_codon:yes stop_codon:yes gene_type:complete